MVIFVMLKWYKLLYYKEILSIYLMTLVKEDYSKQSTTVAVLQLEIEKGRVLVAC